MAASPPRLAPSPVASPASSLGKVTRISRHTPRQHLPPGSPSYGRMQPGTPTVGGTESVELYTNDQGPVTLFTSMVAGWASSLSMGTSIGYSLAAGRSLTHARDDATASVDQKLFWFDSLLPLGAIFGVLWGCCLAFWLGRRWPMAIGSLGSLCAWLVIARAPADSWNLYVARFMVGVSTGVVSLVVPAYIAEIATAKDRGKQEIEVLYVKLPTPLRHYMLAVMIIVLQQFSGVNIILSFATGPMHTTTSLTSRDFYVTLATLQVAFCVGYSIGVGPATWALAVELSPLRGGGCDFGTACVFYWASALAIMSLVWTFSYSATSLALMAFFAASSTLVNGIGAFFLLPDTDSVSLEAILLEGQKNRPQKLRAAHEPTQSSATQQGEEGQKKKQEKPKPPASKQVASAGRSPVHSKLSVPSPGKQASRALSPVSSQFPHDHHSRADDLQEDNVKDVSSPEVEGQKTSSSGKVAAADSARSGRLNLPSGET